MPSRRATAHHTRPPDVARGLAGGVLLGLPLAYTQEIWEHGTNLRPWLTLFLLVVTFGLNIALSHFVGFERGRTERPIEDAIVGFGLAHLLAAGLLLLLDRIDLSTPSVNALVTIALTAIPTSIGFALGNALAPEEGGKGSDKLVGPTGDMLAAGAGAVVLSFNIAPTEEPILLAGELGMYRLIALVLLSLVLSYVMVFYAEFGGREGRSASAGASQGPLTETCLAYLAALLVATALLASFGRLTGAPGTDLAMAVVVGFPASMGAALGRMLV